MTLSLPSAFAAATSPFMPPKSSAEAATAAEAFGTELAPAVEPDAAPEQDVSAAPTRPASSRVEPARRTRRREWGVLCMWGFLLVGDGADGMPAPGLWGGVSS